MRALASRALRAALGAFTEWALKKCPSPNPDGFFRAGDGTWAHTIGLAGSPYLTRVLSPRVRLPIIGEVQVRLHHFHRPDADRHLHNHPFRWSASFILTGSYDEARLDEDAQYLARLCRAGSIPAPESLFTDRRRVRWLNWITDRDYHAIKRLHGDVWTLFITGEYVQDWGYLVDGEHVPHDEYRTHLTRKASKC